MKNKTVDNTKLGFFVLLGLAFLIFSLYMIGRNRNMFGSTFTLKANFHNTNGLLVGNNVRFSGIDVGTVARIRIVSDTSVLVTMIIDKKVKPFIKQNSIATIGTEGLMGNKLININGQSEKADPVEDGTVIETLRPIETDNMLRTLNTTNDNINIISHNLKEITVKLNSSSSLWNLLADSVIAIDLKQAVSRINEAGANTAKVTQDISNIVSKYKDGDGLVETIFTDTALSQNLERSVVEIQKLSKNLTVTSDQLKQAVSKIESGQGPASMLLSDSLSAERLKQTIINIEQGTSRFNEDMEALKSNFLFRKYFREQEKKAKKQKSP
jgi:phospholipid/cholesterol/gamma-HCH transport system substrate-binding protein